MQPEDDLNIRLMNYKNECGCALGAQFMTGAFVLGMALNIWKFGLVSFGFLTHLPLVLLAAFLATGLGKASGLLYARYMVRKLTGQLARMHQITPQED